MCRSPRVKAGLISRVQVDWQGSKSCGRLEAPTLSRLPGRRSVQALSTGCAWLINAALRTYAHYARSPVSGAARE